MAAQAVADDIVSAGGKALAVAADVSRHEDVKAAVDAAVVEFGTLDLAFNNAGIGGPPGPIGEVDIEGYEAVIGVNLNSVFYGMRYQIPEMLMSGGGSIVITSSVLGLVGDANAVSYTTAKHGATGMTKAADLGYAGQGIRINSVHPGYIDTPLLESLPKEAYDALVGRHPAGRLGTSEEVVQVVLFLLSDKAGFVTGSQYAVDGGYTAI